MFSFNLNFGKNKVNKYIERIYIYIYIVNELCFNVEIERIGREFTKGRREFSCFSLKFILEY
jgi:hypothetical protein